MLNLYCTQVSDAGCATLASTIDSGALPALERLDLDDIPASDAAMAAVYEARDTLVKSREEEESGSELGSESEEHEGAEDGEEEWEDDGEVN